MTLHPQRDTNSLTGIVSRALGTRSSKRPDDPVPQLQDVLTELHVGDQQSDRHYDINRIDFGEPSADDTRRDLAAHRERLEQLLQNARELEELLAKEAAQARVLSENLKIDEKRAAAAQAVEEERKATAQARAYAQNSETAENYQAKAESELASAREQLIAAETSVKELQARLAQAQDLVVRSKAKVLETQTRSKEAAKRAELARALTRDAEIRVAKCREAREAAETEISQAQEIAASIALTTETLKRIRELGSRGLPNSS